MSAGKPVTIGAKVEVTRDGATTALEPVYEFSPRDGSAQFPPLDLPGGGRIALAGINASSGTARFIFDGIGITGGTPATLSLDVTHKPLVQLVWWGVYVALAGGLTAFASRIKQVRMLDRIAAARRPAS